MRHVLTNHRKEFEAIGNKGEEKCITRKFSSKNKEVALGIKDVKRIFVVVTTAWTIEEATPFRMLTWTTFRDVFKPLHKKCD